MPRLRTLALLLVVAFGVSCSGAEQQVVSSFFTAVESGNESAVKAISLVEFPGEVESWEIVEVGPTSSEPFALAELEGKMSEISGERKLLKEKNAFFLQDHKSSFDEYTAKREKDPEYEFSGELADFQKQWEEKRSAEEKLDRAFMDVYNEISHMRSAATLSVSTGVNENFEGEVSGKELKLNVNDGSAEKTYKFTLLKFNIVDTERNIRPIGRWVITEIEEEI